VGSVLAGSVELIRKAHRYRKMLGGGMRQVGVLCAAALYALDQQCERLVEDHANAQRLAWGLSQLREFAIDLASVQTNIVAFELKAGLARDFVQRAGELGVRLNAIGPQRLRAVTHLDVSTSDIDHAIARLAQASGAS
jgi:threonine aldolase